MPLLDGHGLETQLIFAFDDFRLDSEKLELRRVGDGQGAIHDVSGASVQLQPQVLDLLVFLVKNRDRVVSKDEVIDEVWNGRAISDGTLNARVNAARTAVGDTGQQQRIIRTLPRKGFRFVAETVEFATDHKSSDATTSSITDSPSSDGITATPVAAAGPSLTVLPFENLDAGSEQEFLADGLTEDVVTALSKLRGFFVTDRSTTFALKNQQLDPRQVAEEMGVRYILQGSVRSAGKRIRVTSQLTDAASGAQLWSERYDRDLNDIFAIQDELTESLIGRIAPELYAAEHARLAALAAAG